MRAHSIVLATALAVLAGPMVADADPLSYSYIEVGGSPYSSRKRDISDPDGKVRVGGTSVSIKAALAFHKNWHVIFTWDRSWQTDKGHLGLDELDIDSRLDIKGDFIRVGPMFNYRVHPKVDAFIGLGVQYSDAEFELEVDDEESRYSLDELGIFVRFGARAMVWRGLELHAAMSGSNIGLITNDVLFDLGARYHFADDRFDVGIKAVVGTRSLAGVNLSGRIYYAEVWRRARGKK